MQDRMSVGGGHGGIQGGVFRCLVRGPSPASQLAFFWPDSRFRAPRHDYAARKQCNARVTRDAWNRTALAWSSSRAQFASDREADVPKLVPKASRAAGLRTG